LFFCSLSAPFWARQVENDWIAGRLAMGHPASMSQLVHRMRRDSKASKPLKKHEKTLKSKD
jgi:hypothetical protein